MRHEEADDDDADEWGRPSRYSIIEYRKVRIDFPLLYTLAGQQEEYPDTRAYC